MNPVYIMKTLWILSGLKLVHSRGGIRFELVSPPLNFRNLPSARKHKFRQTICDNYLRFITFLHYILSFFKWEFEDG